MAVSVCAVATVFNDYKNKPNYNFKLIQLFPINKLRIRDQDANILKLGFISKFAIFICREQLLRGCHCGYTELIYISSCLQ